MAADVRAVRLRSRTPWDVAVEETARPEPGPGQVAIRTEAVGLCGSDVHAVRADAGYEWVPAGVVLGHEAVGTVLSGPLAGTRVVPISIDGCGACADCRAGDTHYCADRDCAGMHFDGGLAEVFVYPADRLHVLADQSLPAPVAALLEPAAVAAQALSRLGGPLAGRRIGISGPGAIGLLSGALALFEGAEVTIVGPPEGAESRMASALALGMRPDTGETGFDYWLDASGAGIAVAAALPRIRRGGAMVVPAMFPRPVELDFNLLVRGQVRLQGTYAAVREDYARAERMLSARAGDLAGIVEEFALEDAVTALRKAAAAEVVKPVVVL
ncbi:zinc-binding dehydrogenase [Gulosibacter sp. 10]|uniref:zinc-dependent alcohol dehydrogenase n=1 Tax=Gulosibacter sp. 10 TaxID=1255570 RepID=UPI00097EE05B|nr:alcohol dehydrogenase catalytic domain-containing protein [Gulosibacter sp. 10]SJM71119.1 Threonine dehydrogenase and related Zn-dependent dehydrogenases [Gulosibacter sp. 10]